MIDVRAVTGDFKRYMTSIPFLTCYKMIYAFFSWNVTSFIEKLLLTSETCESVLNLAHFVFSLTNKYYIDLPNCK